MLGVRPGQFGLGDNYLSEVLKCISKTWEDSVDIQIGANARLEVQTYEKSSLNPAVRPQEHAWLVPTMIPLTDE